MILKFLFDHIVSFIGLLFLWPVLIVVAILIKIKMPGGPALFVQERVGRNGKLFRCHKFRSMTVDHDGTPISMAGESRITPLGAKLRQYKLDELPQLWDVFIGNMSFVGPRPDVPGYADKLTGDDRDVLKLRPGITGPATLKYRLEDEMLSNARELIKNLDLNVDDNERRKTKDVDVNLNLDLNVDDNERRKTKNDNEKDNLDVNDMSDQELAVWYNDNVIYPDKVRLNCYYYRHYSFIKDIQMILCTVFGKNMEYAGEVI